MSLRDPDEQVVRATPRKNSYANGSESGAETQAVLMSVFRTLKQRGMTILLVEQNFHFASKVADRFYLVDHGKIVESFHVDELPSRMSLLNETLGV